MYKSFSGTPEIFKNWQGVLRHRHKARGAEGRIIVLYFPFRQTSPIT
jgi:hypothetical protein